MKVAYIISAYKNPEQIVRLVKRLNNNGASFLIHIDKRSDQSIYLEAQSDLKCFSNIYFLEKHECRWGDFGHVLATIKGLNKIFSENIPCDYIKLLTGQCYPIKSNQQIQEYLEINRGKSFINFFPLPHPEWANGGLPRIESWWNLGFFNKRFNISYLKRRFPDGFKAFGGSSYWLISRESGEYIYNFLAKNKRFTKFFKNVFIPDEIFFQTILINSPLQETIVNNDLLYTSWLPDGDRPMILTKTEISNLVGSSCLFARKFDVAQDAEILDLIDQQLLNVNNE